jgi:hypothetical protein
MIMGDNHKVYVIVESELDAILLHQEIGDMAGVISLGSAQTRPDKLTAELLSGAEIILIALDGDDPGAKEAWLWWPQHFHQARRLPPVKGKDPGEMWKVGVNLSEWLEIGIKGNYGNFQESPKSNTDGAELLSSSLKYLDGINEDLTGWKLWKLIEQGKEHRFATDLAGAVRWDRWYLLEPMTIN